MIRNSEHYKDPTASKALAIIDKEQEKLNLVIKIIKLICKLAGFKIVDRIILLDMKSNKTWR